MQDVVIQHLLLGEPSLAVQMVVHQACLWLLWVSEACLAAGWC